MIPRLRVQGKFHLCFETFEINVFMLLSRLCFNFKAIESVNNWNILILIDSLRGIHTPVAFPVTPPPPPVMICKFQTCLTWKLKSSHSGLFQWISIPALQLLLQCSRSSLNEFSERQPHSLALIWQSNSFRQVSAPLRLLRRLIHWCFITEAAIQLKLWKSLVSC